MTSEKLLFFLQDGASMSENLNHTLLRLRDDPTNIELVHQAFRYVHSIKSEASFLNLDEIAKIAHEMEGFLEQVRGGTLSVTEELVRDLSEMIERLEEMLFDLEQKNASESAVLPSEPVGKETEGGGEASVQTLVASVKRPADGEAEPLSDFTEFERRLLREAWERNERLFRVDCEIEEGAPIKYAKSYLLLNNLELVANVVRTVPPFLPAQDDERYRTFSLFVTAAIGSEELRDAVDVDQIERVHITELGLDTLAAKEAPSRQEEPRRQASETHIRVEAARLDELLEYVQEMKLIAHRLRWTRSVEVEELSKLLPRLDGLLKEMRTVPLEREFRHLPRFARDLARSLGKRVRLSIQGGELLVDRRMLALLADPLLHLVRNAVDHGIEGPEERALLGKEEIGNIAISAVRDGDTLILRVADDGRGIAEEEIVSRGRELGFLTLDEPWTVGGDLLPLLVRPGFSTRGAATTVSGRGVGLDLVHQKVTGVLGGVLRLETARGHGCTFSLELPAKSAYLTFLLARRGTLTIALPARNLGSSIPIAEAEFRADEKGWMESQGAVIYIVRNGDLSPLGAAENNERNVPPDGYLLFLDHLGFRSCVVVDELLFERDIAEERLEVENNEGKRLCAVRINGTLADFLLVRPPVE